MMRVEIWDAMGTPYAITTKNLDLLALWLVETTAEIKPEQNYPARITVYPSFTWDKNHPHGVPDWIAVSHIIGDPGTIRSPLDVVEYMRGQIERAEEYRARRAEQDERI